MRRDFWDTECYLNIVVRISDLLDPSRTRKNNTYAGAYTNSKIRTKNGIHSCNIKGRFSALWLIEQE